MEVSPYYESLQALTDSLEKFVHSVKSQHSRALATDKWTVKDVLCHITSWHEYYAANYQALAEHRVPPLYDGSTAKRNMDTVGELKKYSTKDLIKRLSGAHARLVASVSSGRVGKMTYKKNGRTYSTPDFLIMVTHHIATHTKHVQKAIRL